MSMFASITRILVFAGAAVCGLTVNSPLLAAEVTVPLCSNPQTQIQINACAASRYERIDAELNRVYRQLSGHLPGDRLARLKAVQKTWLKYRDGQCTLESDAYAGGSIYPTIYNSCRAALTEAQVAALKRLLPDM